MNMFSAVKNFVLSMYKFSQEELEYFESKLRLNQLTKGDFLISKDQRCEFIAFLNKGSLRHFSFSEEHDITLHFFIENDWVIDQQSFVSQKPSQNFIQANENCEIVMLNHYDLHHLVFKYPNFLKLGSLLEQNFNNRVRFDMDKSPEKRYKDLLENHPVWIQRFPQKYIASYLGITPETLSRVRSKIK
jgi:CRP-like cAMP-binding protein